MIGKLEFVDGVAKTPFGDYRLSVVKQLVTLDFTPAHPVFSKAFNTSDGAKAEAQKDYVERVRATFSEEALRQLAELLETAETGKGEERLIALSLIRDVVGVTRLKRESGPYHVRKKGADDWTVAVWENGSWWLPGVSRSCPESVFDEIGEKCEPGVNHWQDAARVEAHAHDEARKERAALLKVLREVRATCRGNSKLSKVSGHIDKLCSKHGVDM